ncbi:MAG: dihydroorotate dehydrogenase [Anaerovoracaceae bacterium]|jgi:dihydroorotate dehydrogenase (NAD+) catalytic subunit
MADTRVTLSGLTLDNPVIPASGTFGFGLEFAELYDINVLGSFALKGTTVGPRFGNPLPRIAECDSGMINAVGLQNPGVKAVCGELLPKLKKVYNKKVIANVCGSTVEEYVECAKAFDKEDIVGILEINISCPNVSCGGMSFGNDPETAAGVVKAVKAETVKPVYAKLTPNCPDITEIAAACEEAGADGVSLINTLLGTRIDIRTRRPVIANVNGGFSGPAVFPVALRMVRETAATVDIPVIGIGGIDTADKVIEMIMAGASAVQIGAANLVDPYVCRDIVTELPGRMDELGIKDLDEIRGCAQ